MRVFIEHGDRTNRNKARLKYVLDAWGFEKFLGARRGEARRASSIACPAEAIAPRPALRPHRPHRRARAEAAGPQLDRRRAAGRQAHGRADARARQDRARPRRRRYPPDGLAEPADLRRAGRQGRRSPRPRSRRSASPPRRPRSAPASSPAPATSAAASPPPTPSATPRRSRAGARRASRSTRPVNIHLTGCHHSCAQHYIGDIGLIACKVRDVGGRRRGRGLSRPCRRRLRPRRALGREIFRDVKAEDAPRTVERMLKAYLAHRAGADETLPRLHAPARGRRAQGAGRRGGGRMTQRLPPPIPSLIPENAPFSPEQRAWLNGFFAGLVSLDGAGVTALSPEQSAALMPQAAAARPARRRRRRRSALARPDPADGRAHEARRRPAAAAAHDGRDGAAGLRPVRLQLPGLFRRASFMRAKRSG